jgi:membrane protease YdiL (CAAX protease family)
MDTMEQTRSAMIQNDILPAQARLTGREWGERIVLAILFMGMGALIYIVFSPLRPLLDKTTSDRTVDYLGRAGLTAVLLAVVLLMRRSSHYQKYTPVFVGLLIMTVAVSLDRFLSVYLLEYLGVDGNTPAGFALLKLNEAAIVVSVVILLTRLSGGSLGSIYIQKGKLKLGLAIGLGIFLLAAAGSIPMAGLLFKGEGLTLAHLLPWTPWLLTFVLANAAQEELLFRGLFLRKLQPFFGNFLSILMIAFVFTLLHNGVTYTSSDRIFLAILVPLALAWGYLMQRTDGIWASILFHAGTDIPIMLGIFSNLA